MPDKITPPKKKLTADWLMRGVLTKIGERVDRITGRNWVPSSSLATSELIERTKKLIDSEAIVVPGKGTVVPHNIKLKMQWDKFSDDSEKALTMLENELLTAVADHINDSLYYTYAPLTLQVKTDYFTDGVILFAGFDKFGEEEREVELNVTVPSINVSAAIADIAALKTTVRHTYLATYSVKGDPKEKLLEFPASGRLSVGRTGENELQIDDTSVSKIHASLVVDDEGHLSVADTGSTNGTFVNDQRISYGKATPLESSDRVRFGLIPLTLEFVPPPPEPEPRDVLVEEPLEETMEIDGFEFRRKVSTVPPVDSAPAIPIPSQAFRNDVDLLKDENHEGTAANAGSNETLKATSPAIPIPSRTFNIDPIPIEKNEREIATNDVVAEQPEDEFKTIS